MMKESGDADERKTLERERERESESGPSLNPACPKSSSVEEEQRGQDEKSATKEWRGNTAV